MSQLVKTGRDKAQADAGLDKTIDIALNTTVTAAEAGAAIDASKTAFTDGDGDAVKTIISGNVQIIERPAGFNWPAGLPDVRAVKTGNSFKSTVTAGDLIDLSTYTNTIYVDINQAGDGSAWDNALNSIGTALGNAISAAEPTKIMVKAGVYPRFRAIAASSLARTLTANVAFIAIGGRVEHGTFDDLTWSVNGTYSNVYETSRSVVVSVCNPSLKDIRGNYEQYKWADTLADCAAEPGTWYTDNSTTYVHEHFGRSVNNRNARCMLSARNTELQGDFDSYFYGFDFFGGSTGCLRVQDGVNNTVIVDNCSFQYSAGANMASGLAGLTAIDGVQVLDCNLFAAFNSEASNCSKDGFNGHIYNSKLPTMLMVNCSGYDNGVWPGTAQSCNGFTTHDGIKSIDIGSEWLGSAGTNSGHVSANTENWSVGVTVGESEGDIVNGGNIYFGGFGLWTTEGSGKMWLDSCKDKGTLYGVRNDGTGSLYVRNHEGTGIRENVTVY